MLNLKSPKASYDLVHGSSLVWENVRSKAGSGDIGKLSHDLPIFWFDVNYPSLYTELS
jgi:hypothetical protein